MTYKYQKTPMPEWYYSDSGEWIHPHATPNGQRKGICDRCGLPRPLVDIKDKFYCSLCANFMSQFMCEFQSCTRESVYFDTFYIRVYCEDHKWCDGGGTRLIRYQDYFCEYCRKTKRNMIHEIKICADCEANGRVWYLDTSKKGDASKPPSFVGEIKYGVPCETKEAFVVQKTQRYNGVFVASSDNPMVLNANSVWINGNLQC